ncbi:MAG: 3-deoxy-manno-octulosonate cytidylyltransferase [Bacteroidales bacterium]|nr:3-deoxy-manno-octulosonate cytidylyltransferase [Bacteroidales bacterium]
MKTLGIIPARYASTRFPGKPLVDIAGKTMIQRVFEQASKAFNHVIVATDDIRILDAVENFGGIAIMTSENHLNGTSRCFEAMNIFLEKMNLKFDVVVNIQGDEPLINPQALKDVASLFEDDRTEIATLINKVEYSDELLNPNRIKVVIDKNQRGIYFSRSLIPYVREKSNYPKTIFYSHIGVYAYRSDILEEVSQLAPGMIETAESLEQNRWIENGYYIKTKITDYKSVGVDAPEDIEEILKLLSNIG